MSITRDQLKAIRADINAALKAVGDKHGFSLELGNTSYSTDTFNTKVTGAVIKKTATGNTIDPSQTRFETTAPLFGIDPKSFGKTFTNGGTAFKIVDIKPKSRKYPIIGQNANGTRYKFGPEVALKAS